MQRTCFTAIPIAVAAALCIAATAEEEEQVDLALEQAKQAIEEGDYDVAFALMDRAVGRSPRSAKYRGLRGAASICKGDYESGAADLKAAVKMNLGDAGNGYRPSSDAKLPAARLEHGRRQVERMLRDRPAMGGHGERAAFLQRWAERKFAGEDFGEPIDWDSTPPLHSDAEHLAPDNGDNAAILIEEHYTEGPHAGQPRSFEELWAGAVYELHNVAFARDFIRLHEEAERGTISRNDFVAAILKLELLAAQRTRAFTYSSFCPGRRTKKWPPTPRYGSASGGTYPKT